MTSDVQAIVKTEVFKHEREKTLFRTIFVNTSYCHANRIDVLQEQFVGHVCASNKYFPPKQQEDMPFTSSKSQLESWTFLTSAFVRNLRHDLWPSCLDVTPSLPPTPPCLEEC